jgi:mono/diheme cytochrome c family protein
MKKPMMMLAALPLVFFGTAAVADGHMEAGKAKFEEACVDCHYSDDFAGMPKDEIKGMIKAVAAGEVEHDEDLSGLTDEEIKALAAYMASAE